MVLTPEDVLNKAFQTTKFREGYDQDEVDDFLDQVVAELRRLNQENEELRQQLAGSNVMREAEEQGLSAFPTGPVAPAPSDLSPDDPEAGGSYGLLDLARKVHEEHVRAGATKREQLIKDGEETAARIIRDAESSARTVVAQLELEKAQIEEAVNQLREFEHEYRTKLRLYIESQLTALNEEDSVAGEGLLMTTLESELDSDENQHEAK